MATPEVGSHEEPRPTAYMRRAGCRGKRPCERMRRTAAAVCVRQKNDVVCKGATCAFKAPRHALLTEAKNGVLGAANGSTC